jgi:hypothetical protein
MEIGFAAGAGVPIYAAHRPSDLTLKEYVNVVPSIAEAVKIVKAQPRERPVEGLLINPHASIEEVHGILDRINNHLTGRAGEGDGYTLHRELADLRGKLILPTAFVN